MEPIEPIDFDEASREWRRNKIANADINGFRGSFRYRCGHEKTNGNPCNGPPLVRRFKRNPHALAQGWSPCLTHRKYYPESSWKIT